MTFETQMQLFNAAQRLLQEAERQPNDVAKSLQRLANAYFERGCGMEGLSRAQPLPAQPALEKQGRA
jgi:hypothetical protein